MLGALEVEADDGGLVRVPGAKVQALLARLLLARGQVVAADQLLGDLWPDESAAYLLTLPTYAASASSQLRRLKAADLWRPM